MNTESRGSARSLCAGVLLTVLLTGTPSAEAQQSHRIYSVGNSLTYNLVLFDWVGFMASQRGHSHTRGYHILYGNSLGGIRNSFEAGNHPTDTRGGAYATALGQSSWTGLMVQPFVASAQHEVQAANYYASLLPSASTPMYVFQPFTARTDSTGNLNASVPFSYSATWAQPYTNPAGNVGFAANRAYFETIYNSLVATNPGRAVRSIPVGEVFATIDARINAGTLTGLSSITQLYGDAIHGNQAGYYVAALTAYAVIYGDDPRGLDCPNEVRHLLPSALRAELGQAVWDTLASNYASTAIPSPGGAAVLGVATVCAARRRRRSSSVMAMQ